MGISDCSCQLPLIASQRWKSNQTRFKTQLPFICCVTLDSRLTSLRPRFLMTISSENCCEALSSACCIMGNPRKMLLPPPHLFPPVPPDRCLPKRHACQSQWQLGKTISQYAETTNNEAHYSVGAYSMPGFTRSCLYYLWFSLKPKHWRRERQITAVYNAGSAARPPGISCLCHLKRVTQPLRAGAIMFFFLLLKDDAAFTSYVCWGDYLNQHVKQWEGCLP